MDDEINELLDGLHVENQKEVLFSKLTRVHLYFFKIDESPPEPNSSQKEVKITKQTDIRSFLKRK